MSALFILLCIVVFLAEVGILYFSLRFLLRRFTKVYNKISTGLILFLLLGISILISFVTIPILVITLMDMLYGPLSVC